MDFRSKLQPYLESSYPLQEFWDSFIYLFIHVFICSAEHQPQGHKPTSVLGLDPQTRALFGGCMF